MRGAGLRAHLRLFLHALASYMTGDGDDCFPSAQALADDLGVSRATIFEWQKEAVTAGWLVVLRKKGVGRNGGSGLTNRYLPRIPDEAQQSGDHPTVAGDVAETNSQVATGTNSQVATGTNSQVATRLNQTKDQTKDQTTPGAEVDQVSHVIAESWSDIADAGDRKWAEAVAWLAQRQAEGWSPETIRAVVAWKAGEADTIGLLVHWLKRFDDMSESEVLEKIRPRRRGIHEHYGNSTSATEAEFAADCENEAAWDGWKVSVGTENDYERRLREKGASA